VGAFDERLTLGHCSKPLSMLGENFFCPSTNSCISYSLSIVFPIIDVPIDPMISCGVRENISYRIAPLQMISLVLTINVPEVLDVT
jgi:hypothetical protein